MAEGKTEAVAAEEGLEEGGAAGVRRGGEHGGAVEGEEEEVDAERHPEADEDVGNIEAGVKVGADGSREDERGVEAGTVGDIEAAGQGVRAEQESEDGQGEGEAGRVVVLAEETHGAGGKPVHEGGLVEEADAVDVRGDVVVAVEHLACDFEVDGVYVIEEAGGEDAAQLEDEPGEEDEGDRPWSGGGGLEAGVVHLISDRGGGR